LNKRCWSRLIADRAGVQAVDNSRTPVDVSSGTLLNGTNAVRTDNFGESRYTQKEDNETRNQENFFVTDFFNRRDERSAP
jgi:hypothetical protein